MEMLPYKRMSMYSTEPDDNQTDSNMTQSQSPKNEQMNLLSQINSECKEQK